MRGKELVDGGFSVRSRALGGGVGAELVTVQVTDTVMGQVTVAVMLPVTLQVTAQVI